MAKANLRLVATGLENYGQLRFADPATAKWVAIAST